MWTSQDRWQALGKEPHRVMQVIGGKKATVKRVYELINDPGERKNVTIPYVSAADLALLLIAKHLATFEQHPLAPPRADASYIPSAE